MQDKQHDDDAALTIALKKELENLGVQSAKFAHDAAEKMRSKWWDGEIIVNMKERNMDIGLVDGYVTPTLVPGVCGDPQPHSLPVPTLKTAASYGFTVNLEICAARMGKRKNPEDRLSKRQGKKNSSRL